jgi:hypothetical protein
MDRDELQERIRHRRSGGEPYRRGGATEEEGTGIYERFEPMPEDSRARRAHRPGERRQDVFEQPGPPADPRDESLVPPIEPIWPDVTREADDWARPASSVASAPPPSIAPPPSDVPVDDGGRERGYDEGYVDNFDDEAYADEQYAYPYDWEDTRDRRSSGAGAFAILGFLALGVLALLGGAVLAGVFSGDPGTGAADPTLTPSPSLAESEPPATSQSAAPSAGVSPGASPSAAASGEPVVFPDGFTAEAQPCIVGDADGDGCNSSGATNNGSVWVWVGFRTGSSDDTLSASVLTSDGTVLANGSIELARINCGRVCNGWTYFPFGGLEPGTYDVVVERNGELAAETQFTVN